MAPICTSRALLFGSLFNFWSSGAACLSAIRFISSWLGMRPPLIALMGAEGGRALTAVCVCLPAIVPAGTSAGTTLAKGCVGDTGDFDPLSTYPNARPATRQRMTAIA